MRQISTRSCSNCGTSVPENMRFCPNCGTPGAQPPPIYAQPQKNDSGKLLGKIGCGVGVAILLAVLLLGTAGYFGVRYIAGRVSSTANSTTGGHSTGSGSTSGNANPGATPTQAPIKTSPINATTTYAGIDLTIIDVQQSANRLDDPNIVPDANGSIPGVVRLDFKEHNPGTSAVGFGFYSDGWRLLLPGTSSVAPVSIERQNGLAAGVSQTDWIDFPVPIGSDVSQIKLQLGKDTDAQMVIPLTANADTSAYQPKSFTLAKNQTQYSGLTWTISTATVSWSALATQATKGMRYITLSMKVDNSTTGDFNGYGPDFVRIKTGDLISSVLGGSLDDNLHVAGGSTGTTGDFVFLVPQDVTSYTFLLLDRSGQNHNATIDFVLQ